MQDPSPYLNREIAWLEFNRRVLEEAANAKNPPLERARFLAIFESNLDEFFMVRVSGLIEQVESGIDELSPDGLTPSEQLHQVAEAAKRLRVAAGHQWTNVLEPLLKDEGIEFVTYDELPDRVRSRMRSWFKQEVFPVCTPLLLSPAPTLPFISNRSLNLLVELEPGDQIMRLGRVKVPTTTPRAIPISKGRNRFVLIEEVLRNNLEFLFPKVEIVGAHIFRMLRDADVEIRQLEADDLVESIEQTLRMRRFGDAVLMEASNSMPKTVRQKVLELLELSDEHHFSVAGLIGFGVLHEIASLNKPSLKFGPFHSRLDERLSDGPTIFDTVAKHDVLLHHPYDSFRTVQELVSAAANDPHVIGIKQTLYRVGPESPIVESLLAAADNGKQVAAMVELKARFDESNNLTWARALEHSGAHVTYGFPDLKTHAKLCLIVRREGGQIRTYGHIGTGNYNPTTARQYTDFGLLTSDPDITQDMSELFNFLTGFSRQREYRKLLVAPINMREGLLDRIRREIATHKKKGKGRLLFKLNSLTDVEMIDALLEAAAVGVQVDLIVRGVCCLRLPEAKGKDNVRVVSVVGRFLEHSRAYYFENGGHPELWIGSADLMVRNLDRRVEALTPIESPQLIAHVRDDLLDTYLCDNTNAWYLRPDGGYRRRTPSGAEAFTAQMELIKRPSSSASFSGR